MFRSTYLVACLMGFAALLAGYQIALAHESIHVGDYEIEIGWLNEPPVAGQENAIVVNVSNSGGGSSVPVEDVSSLTLSISYGGQRKALTLQPLGEDMPGQFIAPILPTVPGEYLLTFGGTLGDTEVDAEGYPEEVEPADTLEFPSMQFTGSQSSFGMADWLTYLNLLIGLTALGLGIVALRKRR